MKINTEELMMSKIYKYSYSYDLKEEEVRIESKVADITKENSKNIHFVYPDGFKSIMDVSMLDKYDVYKIGDFIKIDAYSKSADVESVSKSKVLKFVRGRIGELNNRKNKLCRLANLIKE